MTQQNESTTGPIEGLMADINIAMRRLAQRRFETLDDAHTEIMMNLYPTMVEICRQMHEVDEIVADYIENRESYVEPALAAQVFGALTVGTRIVEEVRKMTVLDDVTKKRLGELCDAYEKAAEIAAIGVGEALGDDEDEQSADVPPEDEDEEDDDQEGSR